MERALLQGEVTAQSEKIVQDENWMQQLNVRDQKLDREMEQLRYHEGLKIAVTKSNMEAIEIELTK